MASVLQKTETPSVSMGDRDTSNQGPSTSKSGLHLYRRAKGCVTEGAPSLAMHSKPNPRNIQTERISRKCFPLFLRYVQTAPDFTNRGLKFIPVCLPGHFHKAASFNKAFPQQVCTYIDRKAKVRATHCFNSATF